MPDFIAPGVYLEEVALRSKSIEGVSTTTAGFIGPTRFGPVDLEPEVITNLDEFERMYGDGGQLNFSDAGQMHNYLWHAARAFFSAGGRRLYIARTFRPNGAGDDGIARATVPAAGGATALEVRARFPGAAGNFLVRITVRVGQNIVVGATTRPPSAGCKRMTLSGSATLPTPAPARFIWPSGTKPSRRGVSANPAPGRRPICGCACPPPAHRHRRRSIPRVRAISASSHWA